MTVLVRRGQNIFDVSIQFFGDISFASKIIIDNGLTWSSPLTTGQSLVINNNGVGDEDISNFFQITGKIVQNELPEIQIGDDDTFSSTSITWDSTEITFDNV